MSAKKATKTKGPTEMDTKVAAKDLIASASGVLYTVLHESAVAPIGKGPLRAMPKTYRVIARADDPNRSAIIRQYRETKTLP